MTSSQEKMCGCLKQKERDITLTLIASLLGSDPTDGRFASARIEQCPSCGRYWLFYEWDDPAFTGSYTYLLGLLADDQIAQVSIRNAASLLEGMDWYFMGGDYMYFQNGLRHKSGPIG